MGVDDHEGQEQYWIICKRSGEFLIHPDGSVPWKCGKCGSEVLISPKSLKVQKADPRLVFVCNQCVEQANVPHAELYFNTREQQEGMDFLMRLGIIGKKGEGVPPPGE